MELLSATRFCELRHAKKLTQKEAGTALGVSPNTIARWEGGKLPIPHWVGLVFDMQAKLSARVEEIRRLNEKVAALSLEAKTAESVRDLLEENQSLKKKIRRLERDMRDLADAIQTFGPKADATTGATEVYRALVKKYHPDLNPKHAEIMVDINRLWQAMRSTRAV